MQLYTLQPCAECRKKELDKPAWFCIACLVHRRSASMTEHKGIRLECLLSSARTGYKPQIDVRPIRQKISEAKVQHPSRSARAIVHPSAALRLISACRTAASRWHPVKTRPISARDNNRLALESSLCTKQLLCWLSCSSGPKMTRTSSPLLLTYRTAKCPGGEGTCKAQSSNVAPCRTGPATVIGQGLALSCGLHSRRWLRCILNLSLALSLPLSLSLSLRVSLCFLSHRLRRKMLQTHLAASICRKCCGKHMEIRIAFCPYQPYITQSLVTPAGFPLRAVGAGLEIEAHCRQVRFQGQNSRSSSDDLPVKECTIGPTVKSQSFGRSR